ncbi:flavodoxin [Ructibacterium gallinarum]|uniref:NAD(P)H-dependent oxidoreductase n=1 Tax=Ructibacterium gallinarum TaxID=2779355 RepID=A0A9D5M1P5_9FIRM|nr:flavodoxin [Ructibacterium gallinarum]MBE5039059.1 NAD(P)H-dependent oxidoreductase [Ructibacterium gallinarum]
MKKIFLSMIMIIGLMSLASCGNDNAPNTEPSLTPADNTSLEVSGENAIEPAEDAKSLVVYFSWSGNTENVAKSIQSQTDSDIFEIVPSEPYSDDYNTVLDIAQEEQQQNARPVISESIENIADYDVIYVGYPNWWGDMPMILYTFFDNYDLSGKTVAPFCTSGGSGLSNTVNEIKELEPNADVTQGLHIGGGSASNPDSAVSEWLENIETAN